MARGTDAELKHIAQVIVLNMVCHILEYKLTIKKLFVIFRFQNLLKP